MSLHPPPPASDDLPRAAMPASPCVRNCCLDGDDVCLGCGRSLDEILAWHRADAAGREAILATAAARVRARCARQRRET
jgi:predicted Fe-S protein YdhL (DUF1289 family)